MKTATIRGVVKKTEQCDPKKLNREIIAYIDISSIDRDTKRIIKPQIITVDKAPSRARKRIYTNDIIIATVRPNLNTVSIVPSQYNDQICSTGFCVLRINEKLIDYKYLFYFTQTNFFISNVTKLATGAGYPAVSDDNILDTEIPLPSLPEQKRIAAILEKCDRLRRTRRYSLQLGETFLQSVFLEMFGDPIANPMGWKVLEFCEFCKKITDGTHHSPPEVSAGIPYITAKNIKRDGIDLTEMTFVSKEDHIEIYKRCDPKVGDVLYIKDGVTTGVAKVNNLNYEFSMLSSVALLRTKTELMSPYFLEQYLNYPSVFNFITSQMKGGAIKRLTLDRIKELNAIVPPLTLQEKFAQIVQKHERFRDQQREAARQAEHLFQTLLHQAFNGELTQGNCS